LVLCLVLAFVAATRAQASGPGPETKLDCGVNALFILLQVEGRPVTLDRLEAALPPQHPDGYSMAELADAARSLGLRVEGVRFVKGDRALDRAAIAFIKDSKGGHFLVLRPVGTTSTMVQVIDPPHAPQITDYDRLFESRVWTGRILLPRDPWPVRHALPLVLASLCVPLVSLAVWQQRRSSQCSKSEVPAAS
jgi:hypothetical protein